MSINTDYLNEELLLECMIDEGILLEAKEADENGDVSWIDKNYTKNVIKYYKSCTLNKLKQISKGQKEQLIHIEDQMHKRENEKKIYSILRILMSITVPGISASPEYATKKQLERMINLFKKCNKLCDAEINRRENPNTITESVVNDVINELWEINLECMGNDTEYISENETKKDSNWVEKVDSAVFNKVISKFSDERLGKLLQSTEEARASYKEAIDKREDEKRIVQIIKGTTPLLLGPFRSLLPKNLQPKFYLKSLYKAFLKQERLVQAEMRRRKETVKESLFNSVFESYI